MAAAISTSICCLPASRHASPIDALRDLMEARNLRQRDLIPIFGASSVVSDVIHGKRSISKNHARKLAEFFHVPVSMFI